MQYWSGIQETVVYLFVEMGGKQINLWAKLKLVTQNFKQYVGVHDILSAIFSTPGMWLEEIQKPLFCANSHMLCNIITKNRMHASHIVNVC